MSDYFDRTRAALRNLFGARPPAATEAAPIVSVPIDDSLAIAGDRITFVNPDRAATDPRAWLHLLEGALEHNLPVADQALELIRAQTNRLSADEMLWGSVECRRFVALLRPRPGLAARLEEMLDCGVLPVLFPEFYGKNADNHSLAAVARLERLLSESDLAGKRFGSMLRELNASELVVLALLLHQPAATKEHDPVKAANLARPALDRLLLEDDTRHAVEFLIENQLQMAQFAFRQDTSDPSVIAKFAGALTTAAQLNSLSAEEHLKMLCVLTVGDLGARRAYAAHVLESRAPVAAVRRHLQPFDDGLRRRRDRSRCRDAHRAARSTSVGYRRSRAGAVSRRPAAALPDALRSGHHLPARPAVPQHRARATFTHS